MDGHAVERFGLADDAEDDVGEIGRRLEQEPALQGAGGNFDEGILRNEAQRSRHACLSVRSVESCVCSPKKTLAPHKGVEAIIAQDPVSDVPTPSFAKRLDDAISWV